MLNPYTLGVFVDFYLFLLYNTYRINPSCPEDKSNLESDT